MIFSHTGEILSAMPVFVITAFALSVLYPGIIQILKITSVIISEIKGYTQFKGKIFSEIFIFFDVFILCITYIICLYITVEGLFNLYTLVVYFTVYILSRKYISPYLVSLIRELERLIIKFVYSLCIKGLNILFAIFIKPLLKSASKGNDCKKE